MDPSDLLDLYGGGDQLARARADAMSRRAQGLQGAGMILRTLAGERDPIGGALTQMGQQDENRMVGAIADRPHYQTAALGAQRAQEESDAWKDPASAKLLRGAVKTFMPSLGVDEATPVPVLRNMLPIAEKFGQAGLANQWRAGLQNKIQRKRDFDANTGQYRITYFRPLDGATWDANFRPLSPGIPNMGLSPTPTGQEQIEDVDGGAPAPAPRGPPGSPAAPGGAGPAQSPPPKLTRTPKAPGSSLAPGGDGGYAPNKRADQLSKEMTQTLDPMMSRGGLKQYSDTINRAQKLDALIVDPETGKPKSLLTPQDMTELSIALQQMVSNGHASSTEVEHLVPQGIGQSAAKLLQYWTNQPVDAGQQEWATRMLHSAVRESQTALDSIRQGQIGRVPSTVGLRQLQPKRWEAQMKQFGLNPADFDAYGNLIEGKTGILPGAEAPRLGASGHGAAKAAPNGGDQPPVPGAVKTKSGKWAVKNASGQWEYVGG